MTLLYTAAIILLLLFALIKWLCKTLPQFIQSQRRIGELQDELRRANRKAIEVQCNLSSLESSYDKLQHQKKSSEVKVGQTVEQLTGFLSDFPYPDDEIKALFQPLDLLVFREDEIVFIEIKSREAQLSDKQRKIRKLIEEK